MPLQNKNILIISPESWGTSFVSKHHYAQLLAEHGNKVFFLNPPSPKLEGVRTTRISEQLSVIDYAPAVRGTNRLWRFLRDFFNRMTVYKIQTESIRCQLDIVWSFDPFRFQNLQQWGAACAIYHPVDVHQCPLELDVVRSADMVFSTAQLLLDRFGDVPERTTPRMLVHHGLAQHFLQPVAQPQQWQDQFRLRVGCVGNVLYPYMDRATLLRIIAQHGDVGFYFVGPYENSNLSPQQAAEDKAFIDQLRAAPNVQLVGARPSAELPAYLASFDLFLMCYKGDELRAEMANPHKLLEYLSTGKCVVSHYIDEYKNRKQLLQMAQRNADLPQLFADTLADLPALNSSERQAARRRFAEENTYEKQLQRIETQLEIMGM